MPETIGRFAPTPSGRMHLGNILTALLAYLSAKSKGGKCILRIEDLDAARCQTMPEYTEYLLDDLAYFGFEFDGEVLYQSKRSEIYTEYFNKLKEQELIYPCTCSRAELHAASAPHADDNTPIYDRRCLFRYLRGEPLPAGRKPAFRCRVPDEDLSFTDIFCGDYRENLLRECSDFVVRRSDGVFAYQLAVVVDDALSGVSEVLRGCDLLGSTARQIYLYQKLGFCPPAFGHLPLLTDAKGRRLSKREGDGCMSEVRKKYKTSSPVLGALAAAVGFIPTPEPLTLKELIPLYDALKIRGREVHLPENFM